MQATMYSIFMRICLFTVFVCLLALSSNKQALAQATEKNGLPCLKEICLGDGLAELAALKLTIPKGCKLMDREDIYGEDKKRYFGDPKAINFMLRHLLTSCLMESGSFDSNILPMLAKIEGSCRYSALAGSYINGNGFETIITLLLKPNADGSAQKWTVSRLIRIFPSNWTADQKASFEQQVQAAYGKFHEPTSGKGSVKHYYFGNEPRLDFQLMNDHSEHMELLIHHPKCGVKGNISIN